jgi:hypothetical protein
VPAEVAELVVGGGEVVEQGVRLVAGVHEVGVVDGVGGGAATVVVLLGGLARRRDRVR